MTEYEIEQAIAEVARQKTRERILAEALTTAKGVPKEVQEIAQMIVERQTQKKAPEEEEGDCS